MLLDGKSVIVTGGSVGIGAAIVRLFAKEGARVSFSARSEKAGRELASELRAQGRDVAFMQCDVSTEAGARDMVARTIDRAGGIDVLVNNAGISHMVFIEKMTLAQWNDVVVNNVTSVFLMCREAIPHLRRSPTGNIVNLGSTVSFVGAPEQAAYAMSKAAVVSLTKSLALELANEGIRVNALCPGATVTRLYHDHISLKPEAEAELNRKHPLGRPGTPEEMADAALFLASENATFVTGHSLLVDGGFTAA